MLVIIDRFEGDYAVVEITPDNFVNIPKVLVKDAKEGDVIRIEVDQKETSKRKEKINNLMNQVFEN